jgi:arylsulfatase A-like enzyme
MKNSYLSPVVGPAIASMSFITTSSQSVSATPTRPNILAIIADDLGFGDLSCHGNTVLQTPNIDRFAAEAAEMEYFYTAPVCAPSRAAFLTGRNPLETEVWGVHTGRDYLSLDETTIANVLQTNGYDTAMIGKWHSGRAPAWMPWNRGFNEAWVSVLYNHYGGSITHNGHRMTTTGWTTDTLTDLAVDWIHRKREGPFFLMLAYLAPHGPWAAPPQYVEKYKQKGCEELLATLFGMIDHLDENIGRLLASLDQAGLRENTIVVFISDNGAISWVPELNRGLSEKSKELRNPQHLRGWKGLLWENGIRAPCFIRWPETVRPHKLTAYSDIEDLFPTFLEAARIPVAENQPLPLQGRSLMPLLTEQETDWNTPRSFMKTWWWRGRWSKGTIDPGYTNQMSCVMRDGPWKLIVNTNGTPELYNVLDDPGEIQDLSRTYPEKARTLTGQLKSELQEMIATDRCFKQPRFHIGHPEYDQYDFVGLNLSGSQIPCCSAVQVSGSVDITQHFSTGWTREGDSQTLLVDVVTPGLYDVELEAKGNIAAGSAVKVEVGSSCLQTMISNSGKKVDLGEINLQKGPQNLTLTLESLPDSETCAFNNLWFIWFHKK